MSFVARNFGTLVFLVLIGGLAVGVGTAYTNYDVPYVGQYLSQLKPTATPTLSLGSSSSAPGGTAAAPAGSATPGATGSAPIQIAPAAASSEQTGTSTPAAGRGLAGRATAGTVQSVDGKTITLMAQDGSTVKASVGDSTVYQRTTDISAADIKVGDSVMVTGQEGSDGTVTAQIVQIGGAVGAGATLGAGAQGQGAARQGIMRAVTGAVQKIEGTTLTLSSEGGQTIKVALTSDTRLRKTVAATLSDVKAGEQVTIVGQAGSDGVVAATTIQIGAVR